MRYCSRTHVGKMRRKNEDTVYADGRLFAVADGMGGHHGGEVASARAVKIVADSVRAAPDGSNTGRLLSGAIISANEDVFAKARSGSGPAGMGTTLTAGVLTGDTLTIGHVGDSRAYLFRDGTLTQLTRDHSLVGELLRSGQLTPEQAFDHPNRNVLTQALGTTEEVSADVTTHKLVAGDKVLLCSDGLTTMVRDGEIAGILSGAGDAGELCARLVDAANVAGGADNISVVLLDLAEPDAFEVHESSSFDPPQARPKGRARAALLAVLATGLVVGLAVGIGYYMASNTYYLGFSGDRVAIFRGLPGSFGGLSYSQPIEVTSTTRAQLTPNSQRRVGENLVVGDLDMVTAAIGDLELAAPPPTVIPSLPATTTRPPL